MDVTEARRFVEALDLSGTWRSLKTQSAADDASVTFDHAKNQARLVGSGVFSFAQGVDREVREAISDSALLAQLVANRRASVTVDPITWFAAYAEVLQNVGWTIQDSGWTDYTNWGTAAEVNENIIEVLSVALGPSPAALDLIDATMKALRAMNGNGPWITLFNRESQKANIARFQIGIVEKDAHSDVFVSLLACLVEAHSTITQVLFFKFRDAHATFKASANKVSINRAALAGLSDAIRRRVEAYQADYLSNIADL